MKIVRTPPDPPEYGDDVMSLLDNISAIAFSLKTRENTDPEKVQSQLRYLKGVLESLFEELQKDDDTFRNDLMREIDRMMEKSVYRFAQSVLRDLQKRIREESRVTPDHFMKLQNIKRVVDES